MRDLRSGMQADVREMREELQRGRLAFREEVRADIASLSAKSDAVMERVSTKYDAVMERVSTESKSTRTTAIVMAIASFVALAGLACAFLEEQRSWHRHEFQRQWSEIKGIQHAQQPPPTIQSPVAPPQQLK